MPIDPTSNHVVPPSVAPNSGGGPKAATSSQSSGRLPAVKLTKDTADISKQGHAALDAEAGPPSATPVITDLQSQSVGVRLQARNPDKFKHADGNGDGRLSTKEAKAAGLE